MRANVLFAAAVALILPSAAIAAPAPPAAPVSAPAAEAFSLAP